eukprot:TRINITY_DN4740_c0_g1_i4.p1 TRINITY_DN4740_c0_g1~~TRINITY_DN4740_c0_g1_i4.p1  ORF type:complete len:1850 (+),score=349.48 TRINITY_DN4740_c0_g1_i4:121-5670(+)
MSQAPSAEITMYSGEETNLAELLLVAARASPHEVCIEAQDACWSFAQVASMTANLRVVLREALRRAIAQGDDSIADVTEPPPHGRRADEQIIMIALERGVEALAAVHAVMLEGCAYNCFDVAEHREKMLSWLDVACPPVMISSQSVISRLGLHVGCLGACPAPIVIDVHSAINRRGSHCDEIRSLTEAKHAPEDLDRLAYLIFTSGSTGKPKAVMIQHRSALNLARTWIERVGLHSGDRYAQIASMSWDVHVVETYGALCARAALISVPDHIKKSGPDMLAFLRRSHVTGMSVVASHLRMISGGGQEDVSCSPSGLPHLRILESGGETLSQDVISTWAPGRQMWNAYGPSEITVCCSSARVEPGREITIGQELPTYACYVLDPNTMQQLPSGERGVLFVGGVGLARGYLNEAEKTAAKFVEVEGLGRLYNSGDLVSRDSNNQIIFHGRVDWQVKVRGIRIELEALEQAISQITAVKHCEARVFDEGQKLALIVSGTDELSEEMLKSTAASLGKGYVLSLLQVVEDSAWKFSTAAGKLVRNHVPLASSSDSYDAPDGRITFDRTGASALEIEIAMCLAPLVRAASWHRDSHFLEDLGVDSSGFARLVRLLRSQPQFHRVSLLMLFECPTVTKLAQRVADLSEKDEDVEEMGDRVQTGQSLLDHFLESAARSPHSPCCEEEMQSFTYSQVLQRSLALQRTLRKALKQDLAGDEDEDVEPVVVLFLPSGSALLTSMIASFLEGYSICVLNDKINTADLEERLNLLKPVALLSESSLMNAANLGEVCEGLSKACALLDVSKVPYPTQPLSHIKPRAMNQRLCCVTFAEGADDKATAALTDHTAAREAVDEWVKLTQINCNDRSLVLFHPSEAAGMLGLWCTMAAGATLLFAPPQVISSPVRAVRLFVHWLFQKQASMLGCSASHLEALESSEEAASGSLGSDALRLLWVLGQENNRPEHSPAWAPEGMQSFTAFCCPEAWSLASSELEPQPQKCILHRLQGCSLHFLDAALNPVLPEDGRLFIGGAGVARGYLEDASRSEEKFKYVPGLGHLFDTGLVSTELESGLPGLRSSKSRYRRGSRSLTSALSQKLTRSLTSIGDVFISWAPQGRDNCDNVYGEGSYPRFCKVVQGLTILSEPVMGAVFFLIQERILMPLGVNSAFGTGFGILFLGVMGFTLILTVLKILLLIAAKWLLIGRYREGDHAIYSLFYLRHWIVQRLAQGTPLSTLAHMQTPENSPPLASSSSLSISPGANLIKNLLLKALGADVSLSSVVAPGVVGYDLVHVGPMATVHGPYHLSAVSFAGRRMSLAEQRIGAGAYVGSRSVLEPGSVVADEAYVEPLSSVPCGMEVNGRVSGVPARPVDDDEPMKARTLTKWASACFIFQSCFWALFSWMMLIPTVLDPFLSLVIINKMSGIPKPDPTCYPYCIFQFTPTLLERIWWFPVCSFMGSILTTCIYIVTAIVVCRLLPTAKPPMDVSMTSFKGRLIAFKVAQATGVSNMLSDSALQPVFLRLCGADIGRDTFMSDVQTLPELLTVGDGSFVATDNTLTSLNIDQGRLQIPCRTVLGAHTFVGNRNHIVEGLPEGSFAGLNTWLPRMPAEEKRGHFGNPAMNFARSGQEVEQASKASTCLFNFFSSAVYVFLWPAMKKASVSVTFCTGRSFFPKIHHVWDLIALFGVYLVMPLLIWLVFGVLIPNALHNRSIKGGHTLQSATIQKYMNSQALVKNFVGPFRAEGSAWYAAFLRLSGTKVGRNFFSPGGSLLLWDPMWTEIGDDVTMDFDSVISTHSAEDFKMKFTKRTVGDGAVLMQAATLANADMGRDAVLRPASVTWKGPSLGEDTVYEGAPAETKDIETA